MLHVQRANAQNPNNDNQDDTIEVLRQISAGELPEQNFNSIEAEEFELPTEEDLATLRRVRGKIPWVAYSVAFIELCERFSYYGTTCVCEF